MAYRFFHLCLSLILVGFAAHADPDDVTPGDDNEETARVETKDTSRDHLVILNWRLKKGHLDYDRIASVLGEADLAVIENVEIGERGDTPILVIIGLLERQRNEHICKAWFRDEKNVRGSVALVWRERTLGLIDGEGKLRTACGTHPWVLPMHDVSVAKFFYRPSMRMISVSTLDLPKAPKHANKEIPELFRVDREANWPTFYAGDVKVSAKRTEFDQIRDWHFKAALKNPPGKMTDNIWFKNVGLVESGAMKLRKKFPDVSAAYIKDNLSECLPVRAEFTFNENEMNATQTQLVSKKKSPKAAKKTAATKVKIDAYPAPVADTQMSDLNDDLESEASDAREPDSATKAKKKRKHAK